VQEVHLIWLPTRVVPSSSIDRARQDRARLVGPDLVSELDEVE
jgi:hypothetical protein